MAEKVKIKDLLKSPPFSEYSGLISNDTTLREDLKEYRNKIKDDMKAHGFDESKAIDVWRKVANPLTLVVVDGYTRLSIAEEIGLQEVFMTPHDFYNEEEAMAYAVHNQEARRPSTDYTILIGLRMLDHYQGKKKLTTKKAARTLGIGKSKVEKARAVLHEAKRTHSTKAIEDIRSGKKSINSAYRDAMLARLNAYHSLKLKRGITSWKDPKDRQALAKEVGLGDGTANRFDYVSSRDARLTMKVLAGDKTCNAAYEELKSREGLPSLEQVFFEAIKGLQCPHCHGPAELCISWKCEGQKA